MENNQVGLTTEYGQGVALKSVHLEAKLEGLLLSATLSQKYINDTDESIEATYTFPLGWGAQLMGLAVELNGKRLEAIALLKQQAEKKYEKAIDDGDTPVMVERSKLGLYTANLGNLKPNEQAVIEVKFAQLVRIENGRIRLSIPTVIGQRYGDAEIQGHIQPHQTTEVDLLAEFPFTANLVVCGDLAQSTISCPSHQVEIIDVAATRQVKLAKSGFMDRDFIVLLEDIKAKSFITVEQDGEVYAAIASFCPDFKEEGEGSSLRMKILVDCSGSMKGDSISQAQEALHELSLKLTEADQITYSKFGSNVVHMNDKLENCTNSYLKNYLAKAIHETDADMGGTELNAALTSTFKLSLSQSFSEGCDVLLITDGDVWEIEEITLQAKRTNHRIFAIGVGSAPAESLLRDLAEITGGACELVSANEEISSSVLRMIARMKAQRTKNVTIDWGQKPSWQSSLSKQLFAHETRHVYAILKTKPELPPVISWETTSNKFNSQPSHLDWVTDAVVPRLVAGAELQVSTEEKYCSDIALKYQLVSNYTNLILVHVRDDEDKAQGISRLQKIMQMQAAGQGGFGTVLQNISYMKASVHDSSVNVPSVWRVNRTSAKANVSASLASSQEIENYEIPAFLRKPEESPAAEGKANKDPLIPPKELIEKINGLATSNKSFEDIVRALELEKKLEIISVLCRRLVSDDQSRFASGLAFLIAYIDGHINSSPMLIRHAERLLRLSASKLTPQEESQAPEVINSFLPELKLDDWGRSVSSEESGLLARAIGYFRKK